eukprot:scaffold1509_cov240-Pinguiococcus_pyrenoidosus.AAC.11
MQLFMRGKVRQPKSHFLLLAGALHSPPLRNEGLQNLGHCATRAVARKRRSTASAAKATEAAARRRLNARETGLQDSGPAGPERASPKPDSCRPNHGVARGEVLPPVGPSGVETKARASTSGPPREALKMIRVLGSAAVRRSVRILRCRPLAFRFLSDYPEHEVVGLPALSPTMESGTAC